MTSSIAALVISVTVVTTPVEYEHRSYQELTQADLASHTWLICYKDNPIYRFNTSDEAWYYLDIRFQLGDNALYQIKQWSCDK